MRPRLKMLSGLPASGKTTYAQRIVESAHWDHVNMDNIREYVPTSQVEQTAYEQVNRSLQSRHNVIWDNTSLDPKYEAELRALAHEHNAKFSAKFFAIDPAEAVRRDAGRLVSVGAEAIYSMFNRYLT